MTAMEIIILVLGILAFIASFIVKSKDNAEDMKLSEEEIKRLVDKEFENTKYKLKEASEESVAEAMEKAERNLEKITNEKMLAMGEYSDNILSQISTNHQETVFMYDMLTRNKDELTGYLTTVKESTEEVKDLAKHAKEDAAEAKDISAEALFAANEAMQKNAVAEESMLLARAALSNVPSTPLAEHYNDTPVNNYTYAPAAEEEESAFSYEEENSYSEEETEVASLVDKTGEGLTFVSEPSEVVPEMYEEVISYDEGMVEEHYAPIQSGLGLEEDYKAVGAYSENTAEEYQTLESDIDPAQVKTEPLMEKPIPGEQSAYAQLYDVLKDEEEEEEQEILGGKPQSIKDLINKTNAAQKKSKNVNANSIKAALKKQADPTTFQFDAGGEADDTNKKIITLHKRGKSNMAIAKELGLGVGEVNLVIGLYDH